MPKLHGCVLFVVCGVLSASTLQAANLDDLDELSLEQLLEVEVTSVSRKSESRREAAAAVYVLTGDDLKRSGARTIPDALRTVPGMHVAQIDANKWAVSVRGFNGLFANKLLVLMDGRPLYNAYFSGVFWDEQNIPFDEIERIEVVRGPGATLWGSNAVNGVINIITRSARDTHGWKVEGEAGSRDAYGLSLRHGGVSPGGWHHRVNVTHRENDEATNVLARDDDDLWQDSRVGLRLDKRFNEFSTLQAQAQVYRGQSREAILTLFDNPLRSGPIAHDVDTSGGWLSAQWSSESESGTGYTVKGFFEQARRETAWYEIDRQTANLSFDQHVSLGARHDLVWGMGVTQSKLPMKNAAPLMIQEVFKNEQLTTYEMFVQDEIRVSENIRVILGSKFEDHKYTGFSAQPNARFAWSPHSKVNIWSAVSKAERTPSRGESHFRVFAPQVIPPLSPVNPSPFPILLAIKPQGELDAEEVTAYELGIRYAPSDQWEIEIATFHNQYEDIVANALSEQECYPSGDALLSNPLCVLTSTALVQTMSFNNSDAVDTQGAELTVAHQVSDSLHLTGNISYFEEERGQESSFAQQSGHTAPRWLANGQAEWRISDSMGVNVALRYVDEIERYEIDDYLTMDIRFSWRVRPDVRLEVVGRNLFDAGHLEYASELGEALPAKIRSSFFMRLTWAP